MLHQKRFLSSAILFALSNNAFAQQVTPLEEVVVIGTRTEQRINDVSSAVSVVSSEDIEKGLSSDIKQALRETPGVTVNGSGRFGISGVNIRGMDDSRVKVMVDGVQQPVPYDPGANEQRKYPNSIEVDTLATIEVNKGPSSTLYGSDALGGAVLMRTKNPDDVLKTQDNEHAFSLKTGYASVDSSFKNTISWAMRHDDVESLLMLTYKNGEEYQTHGNGDDITGPDRGAADPGEQEVGNLLAKVFYQLNDKHRIGATVEYYQRSYDEIELSMEGYSIMPGFNYKDNYNFDDSTRLRFGFEHQYVANNKLFDQLQWDINFQQTESNSENYDTSYGFSPYVSGKRMRERNAKDDSIQFDAQFDKSIELANSYHKITYGASYLQNDFSTQNIDYKFDKGTVAPGHTDMPDATSKQWGVFAQNQAFLLDESLIITAGLRYDSFSATPHTNDGFTAEYEKSESDAFTAKLGSVYHFNESFSGFAQVSQGFKAPTVYDLYYFYDDGAVIDANPNLKPESSIAYEAGLRTYSTTTRFELVAFYNDYTDLISQKYLGKVVDGGMEKDHYTKVNIGKAEIYGVEFASTFLLDEMIDAPLGSYSKFSIAYAEGYDKDSGEHLDSVAPLTSNFSIGYDQISGQFGGKVNINMVASKDNWTEANIVDVPGYSVVDITAYYRPNQDLTLRAGLFNALDKEYWLYDDLSAFESDDAGLARKSQAGRNWGINAQLDF